MDSSGSKDLLEPNEVVPTSTARKRKPYELEESCSGRQRTRKRLLRRLEAILDEFSIRTGQQAIVLAAVPESTKVSYTVIGSKPLDDVIRKIRPTVMEKLESALEQQAPPPPVRDDQLFELPPVTIDGIPTRVELLTQAQLRTFIPRMLKYSTGRGKPGWGRPDMRPPWWPQEVPWANIRVDSRTRAEKEKLKWSDALKQVVVNCYKYHEREDLLLVLKKANKEEIMMVEEEAGAIVEVSSVKKANEEEMEMEEEEEEVHATVEVASEPKSVIIMQTDQNNYFIKQPTDTTAHGQNLEHVYILLDPC